jgi:hypothetical protein
MGGLNWTVYPGRKNQPYHNQPSGASLCSAIGRGTERRPCLCRRQLRDDDEAENKEWKKEGKWPFPPNRILRLLTLTTYYFPNTPPNKTNHPRPPPSRTAAIAVAPLGQTCREWIMWDRAEGPVHNWVKIHSVMSVRDADRFYW